MDDAEHMRRAMALAAAVRSGTAPNPWVGCVIVPPPGAEAGATTFEGATAPPGGPHAEADALAAAGVLASGATLYATLEPCAHQGRTPPCTDAIIAAGVGRVVIGVEDPDPQVAGRGIAALRDAGIEVTVGVAADEVAEQLAPYLKHRTTGHPWVVLKMAASLDARTAAPDGTSRWITGEAARQDVAPAAGPLRCRAGGGGHRPGRRPRADRPARTTGSTTPSRCGSSWARRRRTPGCGRPSSSTGDLGDVLAELGRRGVLQLLVEGGATVAHDFHAAGLVDRYVLYLAPAFFGGDDGRPLFAGPGAGTIGDVWRGRLVSVEQLGDDLRVEVAA